MLTDMYQEYPFITSLVLLFVFLAVVKVMLCLASLPVAVATFAELHPGIPLPAVYLLLVAGMVIIGPFYTLSSLRTEGWRFFLVYDNDTVRQQMQRAHCDACN